MMLIFVQSFMKISQRVSELLGGHDIYKKFSKGHNSLKNVDKSYGFIVFVFCI